jgi:hypothetical protein
MVAHLSRNQLSTWDSVPFELQLSGELGQSNTGSTHARRVVGWRVLAQLGHSYFQNRLQRGNDMSGRDSDSVTAGVTDSAVQHSWLKRIDPGRPMLPHGLQLLPEPGNSG